MKRNYLLIAAAAAMFAACSNNDTVREVVIPTENVPFSFAAYSNKATKVDNHNTLDFFYKTFNVYGWKSYDGSNWTNVFDDETNEYFATDKLGDEIYKSVLPSTEWGEYGHTNTTSWNTGWYYEGVRFWDKLATNYQFCAYAPIGAKAKVVCTPQGVITIGDDNQGENPKGTISVDTKNLMATPAKELAYKGFDYDYMTAKLATNSTSSTNVSPVQLVFNHELAKFNIKIKLNDNVTTTRDIIVNEVSIKNIKGTSYYTSTEDKTTPSTGYISGWHTPSGDDVDYSAKGVGSATTGYQINKDLNKDDDEFDNYSDHFIMERLMIPQTINKTNPASQHDAFTGTQAQACIYIKYTIGTEVYEGYWGLANLFDNVAANSTINLLGGNEYTLTINVGPEPIYFTTNVSTWDENTGNSNFYVY